MRDPISKDPSALYFFFYFLNIFKNLGPKLVDSEEFLEAFVAGEMFFYANRGIVQMQRMLAKGLLLVELQKNCHPYQCFAVSYLFKPTKV